MIRYIYIILFTLLLVGCKTTQKVGSVTTHDTIIVNKDSIVLRYVLDSISDKERVEIQVINDTVYRTSYRTIDRWRIKTDTLIKYVDRVRIKEVASEVTKTEKPTWRERVGGGITTVICILIFAWGLVWGIKRF